MHSFYEVLGVSPDASADEVKAAYRKMARVVHPDAAGADTGLFLLVRRAYETLGNEDLRRAYDAELARTADPDTGRTGPGSSPAAAPRTPSSAPAAASPQKAPAPPGYVPLQAVVVALYVALVAGIAAQGSSLFSWVFSPEAGDRLLGYDRWAGPVMPGPVNWLLLLVFPITPLVVAATIVYLVREHLAGFPSLLATAVGLAGVAFLTFGFPALFASTGWWGLLGASTAGAALWCASGPALAATRRRRRRRRREPSSTPVVGDR